MKPCKCNGNIAAKRQDCPKLGLPGRSMCHTGDSEPASDLLASGCADGVVRGASHAGWPGPANGRKLPDGLGCARSFRTAGRNSETWTASTCTTDGRDSRGAASEQLPFFEIPLSTSAASLPLLVCSKRERRALLCAAYGSVYFNIYFRLLSLR